MREAIFWQFMMIGMFFRSLTKSTPRAIALAYSVLLGGNLLADLLVYVFIGDFGLVLKFVAFQLFCLIFGSAAWLMIFSGMGMMFIFIVLFASLAIAIGCKSVFGIMAVVPFLSVSYVIQHKEVSDFMKAARSRLIRKNGLIKKWLPLEHSKPDILILTASSGFGHLVAAKNIADRLEKLAPGKQIEIINIFDYLDENLRQTLETYWEYVANCLPSFYRPLHRFILWDVKNFTRKRTAIAASKIKEELKSPPAVIIVTHPMAVGVGSVLKKELGGKLIIVPTDFCLHQHYLAANVDLYCLPAENCFLKGFNKDKILAKAIVTGIPIAQDYSLLLEKNEARRQLGIPSNRIVIFVNFGGAGILREKIKIELAFFLKFNQYPFYYLLLKETSEELKNLFENFCRRDSYSLVDETRLALAASDVMVGKSGGLSTSEALTSGIPMGIWHHSGPEDFNANFLINNDMGKKIWGIWGLLDDFKKTKQWILSCSQKLQEEFHPKDAGDKIAKIVLSYL